MTDLFAVCEPERLGFLPGCDAVLRDFLQEMIALDQQPADPVAATPKKIRTPVEEDPRPLKRHHADKPVERWQRRKQELQQLRDEAEALQEFAAFLQTRRLPQGTLSPRIQQYLAGRVDWQAATTREIERCQEAQRENQHLKDQLNAFVQISGALQTVLNAGANLRAEQLARNSVASRALQIEMMLSRQQLWTDDAALFDMLEASVNARVGELHSIVDHSSDPLVTVNVEDIQIVRSEESHPVVEFKTARILPFDMDMVSNVCWGVARLGCIASKPGTRVIQRSKDVVSTDTRLPISLESGEMLEIRVRCVVRRFLFKGSFVVIAESLTEWPAHLADSGVWPRTTRETGWGLMHSFADSDGGSSPSVSRFLMRVACTPSTSEADRKLLNSPAMNSIVIPSFRTLIHHRQQNVDNHLMDAALALAH